MMEWYPLVVQWEKYVKKKKRKEEATWTKSEGCGGWDWFTQQSSNLYMFHNSPAKPFAMSL